MADDGAAGPATQTEAAATLQNAAPEALARRLRISLADEAPATREVRYT